MVLIYLIPIWYFKYVPFQDSPNHLLSIHIINNIDNKNYDYIDNFQVGFSIFKPYAVFFFIMLTLSKFLPLLVAEKVFLTIYIVLFAYSFLLVLKSISKSNLFLSFFVFFFIYNLMMFFGFYQYLLSIPVFFLVLKFYIRNQTLNSIRQIVLMNLLLFLLFFCHIMALAAFFITIFSLDFIKNRNWKYLLFLVLKVLPVIVLMVFVNLSYSFSPDFKPVYNSIVGSILNTAGWFYYNNIIDRLVFLIVIVLESLIIINLFRSKPTVYDLRFFIAGIVVFIFYLVFPKAVPAYDVWYINSRLIPFFLLLPVLSYSGKLDHFKINLSMIVMILISLTIWVNCFLFFKEQNKIINDYISGISLVERNSKILPLTAKIKSRINPLGHAWAYYHIEKGGVGPYSFASISYYPLEYLHKPESSYLPNPGENSIELINNNIISHYDYIFLSGKNVRAENVMARSNFRKVYTNKVLTIWETKDINDKRSK